MTKFLLFLLLFCLSFTKIFPKDLSKEESFNRVLTFLDNYQNKYLFRGKFPIKKGKFCYEELKRECQLKAAEQGYCLGNDFLLVNVSLLNLLNIDERTLEEDWFKENKNLGYLIEYPIYGCLLDPMKFIKPIRYSLCNPNVDRLRPLIRTLRHLLYCHNFGDKEVVIYLHCSAGKDRTGEVAGCYLMQYKGYSYHQVHQLNLQIADRKIRRFSVNAMKWYAFYLRETLKIPTIGTIY